MEDENKEWIFQTKVQYAFFATDDSQIEEDGLNLEQVRDKVSSTLEDGLGFTPTNNPNVRVKQPLNEDSELLGLVVSTWYHTEWQGKLYVYGINLSEEEFSDLVKGIREKNEKYLTPLRYGRCP